MTWPDIDSAAEARYLALVALDPSEAHLERFVEGLKDESWRVRRLASERLIDFEPSPTLVRHLVGLLALKDEAGSRNAAAAVLAQLGAPAVAPVIELLGHAEADQRRLAASVAGRLGDTSVAPALIALLRDADSNVQVAAAEALGHLGGDEACRALLGLLTSNEPLLRVCALEGLTEQRSPPPLPVLARLLEDPWARPSTFRLLGLVEHPTAWALVCRALATPSTRDAALGALGVRAGQMGRELELQVAAVLKDARDAVPWLARALDADAPDKRLGALAAAGALADPRLALPVARAVRPGPEAELARAVLLRLGTRGAGLLVSAKGALAQLPAPARVVVAEVIVELAEPSLVAPLGVLLRSDDRDLAELATKALGKTRARGAIPLLLGCFDDASLAPHAARSLVTLAVSWPHEVRQALAPCLDREALEPSLVRAWAEVVKGDAVELLARAAVDPNEAARVAAAESAPFVPALSAALLEAALKDASAEVRRAATQGLSRLEPSVAHALVARALEDVDPSVLSLAAAAAAGLRILDAVPALQRLARHAEPGVVLAALRALASLAALDDALLREALDRDEPEISRQVLVLGADRPWLVTAALRLLSHARADVREAAAAVLEVSAGPEERDGVLRARTRERDPRARRRLELALARLARG